MKGLILSVGRQLDILQIHPLLRRYIGKDEIIGSNVIDVFAFYPEFSFVKDAIAEFENNSTSSKTVHVPFHYHSIELARIRFEKDIDVEVIRSRISENDYIYLFMASSIEYFEEFYQLLRKKERLYLDSVSVLKEISMEVLNEPSSKVAARKSIDMVARLFQADTAIMRLYKNNRVLEKYVSSGLHGDYIGSHVEIDPRDVPAYMTAIEEKRPVFDDNPEKGLGVLHADYIKFHEIKLLVALPIISGNRVAGILSLSFKEDNPIIRESADILENVVNELKLLLEKSDYFLELLDTTERLKNLNIAIVTSLSNAIETRDPYTKGHSERVAAYAVEIARNLGWDDYELEKLRIAGVLHDIGKVGIPDAVLLKPSNLSEHEREIMNLHPELSAAIVSEIESFSELVPWVRFHHENFAGTGYPYGLKGNEIPLGARILAVADGFDAMTSDRPYRKAIHFEQAREILQEGAGTQWDPDIVKIALDNLDVIFQKTPSFYHIPEILDEFRRRIFNMNLMDGLYLYEYLHDEAVQHIQENKSFSIAVISLKEYISQFNPVDKKRALVNLIDSIKTNIHYPIVVSRYNYYEVILLAPLVNKQFMRKVINKVLVDFFQKTNLFYSSNIMSFPEDSINIDHLLDRLLSEKKQTDVMN
ncbi:MAG: hypothetical protein A2Y33_01325 [Spirochaetes bacterium GWF1_51_8]|nr:MAG: hypothetical protein A2Y33_01325 [Spirochaetes bacterium GWF1_51_8]